MFALVLSLLFATAINTKTEHHEMTVNRDGDRYDVLVVDRDLGVTVANVQLEIGHKMVATADTGDLHTTVRLRLGADEDVIRAVVQQNGRKIDMLQILAPLLPGETRSQLPLRVGGDVKAPRVINRVDPIYPADLRAAKISGIVILEAIINDQGAVEDVELLKGDPELGQAAEDAVQQWTFEPATLNGKPVPVIFNLTVNFKLN